MSDKLTFWGLFFILIVNASFSGSFVFGKIGVGHFPPLLFATMRFALVILFLFPFLRIDKEVLQHWKIVLGFCLIMGPANYAATYFALFLSNGSSEILIGTQFATPVATLMGIFFLRERVSFIIWIGITLAMIGVFIVGFDSVILGYPLGFAVILISALCYATATVMSRSLKTTKISVLNLNAMMAIISVPILFLCSWLFNEPWIEPIQTADQLSWFTVIYSSLVVSLVGHLGMFMLLKRYSIATVMPYYVFTPIFGVVASILFLNEEPTLRFAVGAIVAILGIFLINRMHKQ